MIVGLGTDLIGVARIRAVYTRQGERFLAKVYTAEEQTYCLAARDPAERLAARWAAKEATMKALGTGWTNGIDFRQIAVINDPHGPPRLHLTGPAAVWAAKIHATQWHLTLSHSDGMAIAVAIAEFFHSS